MKIDVWNKLQMFAYPVYLLIFVHLLVIAPDEHKIIYIALFSFYIILNIINDKFEKIRKYKLGFVSLFLIIIIALLNIDFNAEVLRIEEQTLKDGIYYGEAIGYKNYLVKVNVQIEENIIKDIEIVDCGCTYPAKGIDFEQAVYDLRDDIVEKNSLDVDTISGATKSTTGLINSVNSALENALIYE